MPSSIAAHQRWSLAEFLRQRRVLVRLVPGRYLELTVQLERQLIRAHRQSEPCRSTGELIPRGLIVAFVRTGLLVSVLALRQFASIIGPVLFALILVIGVHPMTGILRPLRGTAVTGR